jgi:hypothetical protein
MPANTQEAKSVDESNADNEFDQYSSNSKPIAEKDIPRNICTHDGYKAEGKKTLTFSRWLDNLLTFGDDAGWSHANKRLAMMMRATGTLANYLRRPEVRALSMSQLIQALLKEFAAAEELRTTVALSQLRHRPGMSLAKFNERFDNLVSDLDMTEPQKVLAYLRALQPEFRRAFKTVPKSLTKAYDFVKSIEALQEIDGDSVISNKSSSSREHSDKGHRSNGRSNYSRDYSQSTSRDSKFRRRSRSRSPMRKDNYRDRSSRQERPNRNRSRSRSPPRSQQKDKRHDYRGSNNNNHDDRDKYKKPQVNNVKLISDSESESNSDSSSHDSSSEENYGVDE